MPLDKKHKAFRFPKVMPIDANNVIFEQAFARLLVLARTKGLPITSTTKATLHPEDLVDIITQDDEHFQGIKDDPQRKRLLEQWLASDFTTCVKEGRGRAGEARIASMKPIHMSTIKLLDPRIRSQDRDVSVFLYNIFRDSGLLDTESLMPFLTQGTIDFGEHDLKIYEAEAKKLDIEALFLLRLLENFKVDLADRRKKVVTHDFLCLAQKQLIVNDTARLLVYKDSIPRRELIQYLMMLLSFHTALYCIKSFAMVNGIVDTKKLRCSRCKGMRSDDDINSLSQCDYHPDIFVDLTNGQSETCDRLAKENVARHYATMYRYFRSHYKLAKLDEFARTFPGYAGTLDELVKFMGHKDVDAFFRVKLSDVTKVEDGEEQDPEIRAVVDLKLPPFDAYVEILTQKTFKSRIKNHRKLMASLCGLNRDDGFLHGGRGQKRKYVLGSQLLELLVQLAVVDARSRHGHIGFYTKPITITEFVKWLWNRYGILIDNSRNSGDNPEVGRALEANYSALKDRLRQLGFFTDLSDASISQVIRPRFPINSKAE
ncbi:MAG: hypothetical protein ABSG38_12715 [Spirochaetia bacterium]|jgi:hypothetical protein